MFSNNQINSWSFWSWHQQSRENHQNLTQANNSSSLEVSSFNIKAFLNTSLLCSNNFRFYSFSLPYMTSLFKSLSNIQLHNNFFVKAWHSNAQMQGHVTCTTLFHGSAARWGKQRCSTPFVAYDFWGWLDTVSSLPLFVSYHSFLTLLKLNQKR